MLVEQGRFGSDWCLISLRLVLTLARSFMRHSVRGWHGACLRAPCSFWWLSGQKEGQAALDVENGAVVGLKKTKHPVNAAALESFYGPQFPGPIVPGLPTDHYHAAVM